MAEEKKKHPGGRPTKYNAQFHPMVARLLAEKGLTDKQMAAEIGITESTFHAWKHDHPQFSESLTAGKEGPDELVERSLFQMATGYTYETEKALVISDGKDNGSHPEIVKVRETIPPNPTSMIFWLKNRRPDKWRDKQDVALTDGEGKNLNISLSIDPRGV